MKRYKIQEPTLKKNNNNTKRLPRKDNNAFPCLPRSSFSMSGSVHRGTGVPPGRLQHSPSNT